MPAPSGPAGDVADRLERLAVHSPARGVDPDRLWRLGRRRQGRRWVVAAACAVVLAGVGTLSVAPLARLLDPPIAGNPDGAWVLPDVVRQPGGWEPAFPAAPGRLSAVGVGQREYFLSSSATLWGVSATTGESRWLDLPGAIASAQSAAQLSADGRRLAYWVTGDVFGDALSTGGTEDNTPVVGLAVMELETGEVQRWDVESEHGLSVQGLVWAGHALWWQGGPVVPMGTGVSSADVRTRIWDLGTDERTEVADQDARASVHLSEPGGAPDGFVTLPRTLRLERVIGSGTPTPLRVDLPAGFPSSAGLVDTSMAPDGARVAALMVPDATAFDDTVGKRLLVGSVADGKVTMKRIRPVAARTVLGWRSPSEVVLVSATTGSFRSGVQTASELWLSDLSDARRPAFAPWIWVEARTVPEFAADAFTAEVVPAPEVPFAPDPRLVAGVVTLLVLMAMPLWRRVRSLRGHP